MSRCRQWHGPVVHFDVVGKDSEGTLIGVRRGGLNAAVNTPSAPIRQPASQAESRARNRRTGTMRHTIRSVETVP